MNQPHIYAPPLPRQAHDAWVALFDLTQRVPQGWTVIGGQLAHLHTWQRSQITPAGVTTTVTTRATFYVDTGLDVRGFPHIAVEATAFLKDAGFSPDVPSTDSPVVQWRRADAEIDVLIPTHVGVVVKDINGDDMLASYGIQQALDRSEPVRLTLADGPSGVIYRPNLFGSVIAKCAAFANSSDTRMQRHAEDLAVLLGLIREEDLATEYVRPRDVQHLGHAVRNPMLESFLVSADSPARVGLELIRHAAETDMHHREVARYEQSQGMSVCRICHRPFSQSPADNSSSVWCRAARQQPRRTQP